MRTILVGIFVALFFNQISAIDESSENEYDVELEDDADAAQPMEEADFGSNEQNLNQIADFISDGLFFDTHEENEAGNILKRYNDILERSLLIRLENLLRQVRNEHGITKSHTQRGSCTLFRSNPTTVHRCVKKKTTLGDIHACHLSCKAGYHLAHVLPRYELCGAATKWRWTYQLRGLFQAFERCLHGPASKVSPSACTTPNCMATAAYYMDKIDYTVEPCDDFYEYSCGRWLKEVKFPPGAKGRYLTYSVLRDRVKWNMAKLCEKPLEASDSAAVRKTKIVYKSCMDTDRINYLDSEPLLKFLSGHLTWPVIHHHWSIYNFDLESTLGILRGRYHNNILFTLKVGKSNGIYILQTWKGKMALPTAYYVEPRYQNRKQAYFDLMVDTATMLGAHHDTAVRDMTRVLQFETDLSVLKAYELDYFTEQTIADMNADIPGIDWLKLFTKMILTSKITPSTRLQVWNVNYLKAMIKLLGRTDPRIVQNYIIWRIIKHRIPNLSERFQKRYLQYKEVMYGTRSLVPRWHTCSNFVIYSLKGPTGKMFVDKYFSPSKKQSAETMFRNIRNGFVHLLDTEVDWMDNKTKSYAKEKAMAIKPFIGYNPKIYTNVTYLNEELRHFRPVETDYFGNVVRLLTEISQNAFKKLGKSYNKTDYAESNTRPTMVNAFYSPNHNTIDLPAGEMQYPFYWGDKFPRMFQYGAIGTILGHEITHGFDNTGSKFDKHGNRRNWWSSKSLAQFHKRTKCIENQYSNYFWPVAGEYLNGRKTLGENIADCGGIRESYQGYRYWLAQNNLTSEAIEPATGLTNDQMFFVGFANVRCAKYTQKAAEHALATSVHSPGRYRVIGSLQNFEKFSEAFKCKPKSYMNPEKKCILW